ncbi:MAG TPA: hypothetical protein PLR83_07580 [Pyrinomonadaceae bacterium]|nr:hypothetical protein [Pyrinomonadaceae bacterium]
MNAPNLEHIGGDMNASGVRNLNMPKLKHVGGNFVVDGTHLAKLPPSLEYIGGDAMISGSEPISLFIELLEFKRQGKLKGNIVLDGIVVDGSQTETDRPWWRSW